MDWTSIIPSFVAAFAVAVVLSWFKLKTKEYNPKGSIWYQGLIRPHRFIGGFTLTAGLISCIAGLLAAINLKGAMVYGSAVSIMGALISIGILPSLTRFHDLIWTEKGVAGPGSLRFQALWFKRNSMDWSEINNIEYDKSQHLFIENNDSEKIFWSKYFKGFEHFESSLQFYRPDLKWPKR